jgi:hypothetical protein
VSAGQDGGAAFPGISHGMNELNGMPFMREEPGMSLRDWFAGQALAGLLAGGHYVDTGVLGPDATRCMADDAYAIARHMLAARTAAAPARKDGRAGE